MRDRPGGSGRAREAKRGGLHNEVGIGVAVHIGKRHPCAAAPPQVNATGRRHIGKAPRPVVAQPMYNIIMRMAENDYLPACAHYGIGVAPFSPLARGALTGKYKEGTEHPAGSRAARGDASILNRDFSKESFRVVEAIRGHAAKRGMTPAEFAVLWVLNNRTVSTVIAGPRTLDQWNGYIGALRHTFAAEDELFGIAMLLLVAGYETWYATPYGRIVDALEQLAKLLYPTRFP